MQQDHLHKALIVKKQKLHAVSNALKDRFMGLDNVIDEVMTLVTPWFLFPEAQIRPTVINLWGLTGSGKTALVQMIVELLDYRKLYSHIDMGEFESDSASWVKNIFTNDLSYFHGKPALICLDEFQFAKTLDGRNNELGKDKLRVIWELLDSGKIEYIPDQSTYYLFKADSCLRRLEKARRANVVIENGTVVSEVEKFIGIFSNFYFDDLHRYNMAMGAEYFVSEDFIEGMFQFFDDEEYSRDEMKRRIQACSLEGLIALIQEGMRTKPATKVLDLSRSLIFVLGNLDEAYSMSHSMNPDISADEFHEQTSKITIADIKKALRKRFRAEQIARLGNNHIIYKSFNSAQFRLLIRQELARVGAFVKDNFGWTISFDESVVSVVYAEGVFPAQGIRPVLTTIKNLVESRISNLVVSILEYQLPVTDILWTFENGHFVYRLKDNSGEVISRITDEAKLKLENLRKSVDPELQAHTAVHEAGHAVLAALTFRIVPSVVVSRTASDLEGFCIINTPKGPMTKDSIMKEIVVCLGGYVAERMIFGEKYTSSGVYSDIVQASTLANSAVRKFAMGDDPIHLAVRTTKEEDVFTVSAKYEEEALKIVRECESEAQRLLRRNKRLLLKVAEYLTVNSRMEQPLIQEYIETYAAEDWVRSSGLIAKEEYYRFNSILRKHLREMEEVEIDVESVLSESNA